MSAASKRVDARMASKVDPNTLSQATDPGLYERLALELACEIHYERSTDCVVSWAAQAEACAYFNQHGFVLTLEHMHRLLAARLEREASV